MELLQPVHTIIEIATCADGWSREHGTLFYRDNISITIPFASSYEVKDLCRAADMILRNLDKNMSLGIYSKEVRNKVAEIMSHLATIRDITNAISN